MRKVGEKLYHSRKRIRHDRWNYANPWWYFVTICVQNRKHMFGNIVGATHASPEMNLNIGPTIRLNSTGRIVQTAWESLPEHYGVTLGQFQIMPNHLHFIIEIVGVTSACLKTSQALPTGGENETGGACPAPTLGNIVGSFKSECTKRIRTQNNDPTLIIWQRGYYDRVIRNDSELDRIRTYILDNPKHWPDDDYFS